MALEDELEKRIAEIYTQASRDVTRKWEKYAESFARKDSVKRKLVEAGSLSKEEYREWRKGQILIGERWKDMVNVLSEDLVHADALAVSMINEFTPEAYAIGHNYGTFLVEKGSRIDTSYALYSRETVERLVQEKPSRLMNGEFRLLNITKYEQDLPKDKRWNQKHIANQITQGILQGEDIKQVSRRLQSVTDMDERAALRNARTAMTGAQNGGRIDAYQRAADMGIKVEKEWLATMDGHTRDSHIDMDGEHVPVDDVFSNGLEYPGEAGGPPAEVYNCRCTLIPRLADVDYSKDNDLRWRREDELGDMSWEEWRQTHAGRDKTPESGFRVVQGKDISGTWVRRPDQFAFAIEDVINAQEFDGVPRVVSQEEFDKAVQESQFVAQRTYSAPDQQTLDAYRHQLYEGKWYVDCSVGGASFGKGMYAIPDYNGIVSQEMKSGINMYSSMYGSRPYYVETFTVSKDLRIITTSEIEEMKQSLQSKAIREIIDSGMDENVAKKWDSIINVDNGTFAAIRGYDAVKVIKETSDYPEIIILNRTKCIFLGGD